MSANIVCCRAFRKIGEEPWSMWRLHIYDDSFDSAGTNGVVIVPCALMPDSSS